MSNALTLPKGFGPVSSVLAGKANANDELGSGIQSSYGIIGYRGKVWSTKYQGKETPLMREDGDGPRGSVEVVIVKAATAIAKIFYKNGYQDGANAAPDCWSSDGIRPDAAAQGKQSPTCANCPMNAWGSRVTDSGKPGKACSDSRRVAVVPANDLANEIMGGPMLLRVPAASLKDLKAYGELLNSYGYPYYGVATRISFDPKEAFPKMVFAAIRPLDDAEASEVQTLRGDKRVSAVLSEAAQEYKVQEEVPASPFEQPASPATTTTTSPKEPAQAATPKPTATSVAPAKAPAKAAASKPSPKAEPEVIDTVTEEGKVPGSFDEMLDNLL
jgi:hypothetical protein